MQCNHNTDTASFNFFQVSVKLNPMESYVTFLYTSNCIWNSLNKNGVECHNSENTDNQCADERSIFTWRQRHDREITLKNGWLFPIPCFLIFHSSDLIIALLIVDVNKLCRFYIYRNITLKFLHFYYIKQ